MGRWCDLEAGHPLKAFRQLGMTLATSKLSSIFPEGLDEDTGLQIQSSAKKSQSASLKLVWMI
jgi:hypothetical protein